MGHIRHWIEIHCANIKSLRYDQHTGESLCHTIKTNITEDGSHNLMPVKCLSQHNGAVHGQCPAEKTRNIGNQG